jgi:hypothetical protein
MSEEDDSAFAVEYRPAGADTGLPRNVEEFLLGVPGVSGFRLAGQREDKRIIVMIATPEIAGKLPRSYGTYRLEPEVTGKFHAY